MHMDRLPSMSHWFECRCLLHVLHWDLWICGCATMGWMEMVPMCKKSVPLTVIRHSELLLHQNQCSNRICNVAKEMVKCITTHVKACSNLPNLVTPSCNQSASSIYGVTSHHGNKMLWLISQHCSASWRTRCQVDLSMPSRWPHFSRWLIDDL